MLFRQNWHWNRLEERMFGVNRMKNIQHVLDISWLLKPKNTSVFTQCHAVADFSKNLSGAWNSGPQSKLSNQTLVDAEVVAFPNSNHPRAIDDKRSEAGEIESTFPQVVIEGSLGSKVLIQCGDLIIRKRILRISNLCTKS